MLTLYGNHLTHVDGKVPPSVQKSVIAVLHRAVREGGREGGRDQLAQNSPVASFLMGYLIVSCFLEQGS